MHYNIEKILTSAGNGNVTPKKSDWTNTNEKVYANILTLKRIYDAGYSLFHSNVTLKIILKY